MSSNMSGSDDQVHRVAKEEIEISSGEPMGVNPPKNKPKRKRYHRHTPQQIQAMEKFFRDCPHPGNRQRIELSQVIGIDHLQVKFWFQNKRTQMKMKHEHDQHKNLLIENEKLRAENMRFREAISNASCPVCGCMAEIEDVPLDERHLRMENARLREEINHISGVAANYFGKPLTNPPTTPPSSILRANNLGLSPMLRGSSSKRKGEQESNDELENNRP